MDGIGEGRGDRHAVALRHDRRRGVAHVRRIGIVGLVGLAAALVGADADDTIVDAAARRRGDGGPSSRRGMTA